MPSTLGTSTSTGPLETTSSTLSPLNSVPLLGVWEITSPLATLSLFSSVPRSTSKPALLQGLGGGVGVLAGVVAHLDRLAGPC